MNPEAFVLAMHTWADLAGGFGLIKFTINITLGLETPFPPNKIIHIGTLPPPVRKIESPEKKILEPHIGKYALNCHLPLPTKEWTANINST